MDLNAAWDVILKQGALFAVMAIVIYYLFKYVTKAITDGESREKSLTEKNDAFMKMIIDSSDSNAKAAEQRTEAILKVVSANTAVMERVEGKLNESTNGPH